MTQAVDKQYRVLNNTGDFDIVHFETSINQVLGLEEVLNNLDNTITIQAPQALYNNALTNLLATNVQDAIDELDSIIKEVKNRISGVAGETFTVLQSNWVYDSDSSLYKYSLGHGLNSEKIILDAYEINSKQKIILPTTIIDKDTIEIYNDTNNDIVLNILLVSNITSSGSNGESFSILSSQWNYEEGMFKFILNHNFNSEGIVVDCYNLDTKEKTTLPVRIIDSNNIELQSLDSINAIINISLINTNKLLNTISKEKNYTIKKEEWKQYDSLIYKYELNHSLNARILSIRARFNNSPFITVNDIIDTNNITIYTVEPEEIELKLIYEEVK